MLTMWRYVQIKRSLNRSLIRNLNRNLNRSSLYINNGEVTQTAAVGTAAVCLGH